MNSNVTALVAARMGSSRFAGKSLADLCGKPAIERLVERMRASDAIDRVVLATTELATDDSLEAWCATAGVECFRGSSDDVLGRLRGAAETYDCEVIVEALGDNPLIHSDLIDAALALFEDGGYDYVATVTNEYPKADPALRRFPIGIRPQIMSIDALRRCEEMATHPDHREHSTSLIAQNPDLFKTGYVEAAGPFVDLNRPELTFAVNHRENHDLVRAIFEKGLEIDTNFSVSDAVRIFDANPDLKPLMGAQE